jgi:hypothetical protein
MKDKRNPLRLAIRSIAFSSLTLFIGAYIVLYIREAISTPSLGEIGLLPLAFLGIVIVGFGVILGIFAGMQALRLSKMLPANEKSRVLIYAWFGIGLSLVELAYFYAVWNMG